MVLNNLLSPSSIMPVPNISKRSNFNDDSPLLYILVYAHHFLLRTLGTLIGLNDIKLIFTLLSYSSFYIYI